MTCTARPSMPRSRKPVSICAMQPGFAVATHVAPVVGDVIHLRGHQPPRHLALDDGVQPRRPAAPVRRRHLAQLEARDLPHDRPRRLRHLLRVHEVTRVLVCDRLRHCAQARRVHASATNSSTSFVSAANRRARSRYSASPASRSPYSFIVEPHPAELTMIASTPRVEKRVDVPPRQIAREPAVATVQAQRAAARLPLGEQHAISEPVQHTYGRLMRLAGTCAASRSRPASRRSS